MTTEEYAPTARPEEEGKEVLRLLPNELFPAFLFLITLSLLGLEFPLAYLFLPVVLFATYKRDKHDFLIQFTILCGGYGFFSEDTAFPFKFMDIALLLSIITIFLYRRDKIINKLLLFTGGYIVVLFLLAMTSSESMGIQIRRMREYWGILYFMFPLLVFSRETFDIKIFYRKIFTYVFLIALFYCIDSLILGGNVFLPRTHSYSGYYSTYYDFYCYPGTFPRKYPPGLFLLALCIYPVLKFYTLQLKHFIAIAAALLVCRTFSIIGGIVLTFLFFTGNIRRTLKYLVICVLLFIAGYYIDGAMGGQLRIRQLVEQFEVLKSRDDEEMLAEFGTGRMAQIIPKVDLLLSMGKQYTGLGFLHETLTTNDQFVIKNEFYSDVTQSEEVAARVEETHIQTVLDAGLIGLLIQTFFYIALYLWVLRPLPYSRSYLVVLVCVSLFGVGGFGGVIMHTTLFPLGLTIGSILLMEKQRQEAEINS
ncbi:MAG: hypothetical protein LUC18_05290 [Porphyromonadaceae bacterium]|nr:hypothetical protein [Porphyromonadaceae bacterium]